MMQMRPKNVQRLVRPDVIGHWKNSFKMLNKLLFSFIILFPLFLYSQGIPPGYKDNDYVKPVLKPKIFLIDDIATIISFTKNRLIISRNGYNITPIKNLIIKPNDIVTILPGELLTLRLNNHILKLESKNELKTFIIKTKTPSNFQKYYYKL